MAGYFDVAARQTIRWIYRPKALGSQRRCPHTSFSGKGRLAIRGAIGRFRRGLA